jgi:LuxR family transcriptional regulator, maltose regulon positive regulatory protein
VVEPALDPADDRSFLPKDQSVSRSEHSRAQRGNGTARPAAALPSRVTDPVEAAAFSVPPRPAGVVRRARLESLLDAGARGPLTLVSAPAGTGKTVLVSSWAAGLGSGRTVVWLSLRDATIGPGAFWHLIVTGLGRSGVEVPAAVSSGPDAGDPSYTTSIAEAIVGHPEPVVLVLDCDGVLTSEVAGRLDSLMQRSGGHLRVVLLGREDPLLPLHRYRLAGTLTELRMADLGFTRDEARAMLTGLGVDLSEGAMDAMIGRTQGWAAGLRMAAMSLAHRADREEAARKLAGDTGTVAEYLLAEVLDTQPAGIRRLLLDTSVVDVLRPGLATALAGPHADRALSFLVHGNAFLEELREGVGCYRYHDLFRQLLRAQLAYESPERWVELHAVAASWFAAHDLVGEAARHAVLVEEWDLASRYVVDDLSVVSLLTGRPSEGLHEALSTLPRTADGAAALIVNAARSAASGDLKGAAAGLERARKELAGASADSWPAAELAVAVVEVVLARRMGDADRALTASAVAQTLVQMQDPARLAAHPEIEAEVEVNVAAALVLQGRLDEAADVLATFAGRSDVAGREQAHIDALGHGAVLAAWRGDLNRAVDLAGRAIRLSSATGLTTAACPAAAEVALAYVDTERYELFGARVHADGAASCGTTVRDPLPAAMLALAHARIHRAGGDVEGAVRALDAASHELPTWLQDRIGVERASMMRDLGSAAVGLDDDAGASAQVIDVEVSGLAVRDRRSPLAARVAACVHSATGKLSAGHESGALRDLEQALRLAAPEQSRRVFREAPDELWNLLRRHDDLWSRHGWLTDRRPRAERARVPHPRTGVRSTAQSDEPPRIYEPLTDKEREVLGHLSELLTTEEIAAVMFISVNTVRTHVRNILRKLAASRRNEAVRRARDLKLILS